MVSFSKNGYLSAQIKGKKILRNTPLYACSNTKTPRYCRKGNAHQIRHTLTKQRLYTEASNDNTKQQDNLLETLKFLLEVWTTTGTDIVICRQIDQIRWRQDRLGRRYDLHFCRAVRHTKPTENGWLCSSVYDRILAVCGLRRNSTNEARWTTKCEVARWDVLKSLH
jgi:hypothetical protein